MIWNSVPLMTLVDVVIISVTVASVWVTLKQRRQLLEAGALRSTVLLLAGLSLIGAFYLVDLWTMYVLPRQTSPMEAMATMEDLHLNWNWLAVLAAVVCIFAGLQGVVRSQSTLISSLGATEAQVRQEARQRQSVEVALASTEAALVQALEASRMGTWTFDPKTGEVLWSDGVEEIFGVPLGTFDRTFDGYLDLIHPDDVDLVREKALAALEAGSSYEVEHRILSADGSVRWLEGKGRSFLDADGTPVRMAGVVWDISERKDALRGRKVAEAEREALAGIILRRQRLESLGTLAGGIAHDFNNLLTPILGFTDLLAGDPEVTTGAKESLDQIRIAAERARGLVGQILAFGGGGETKRVVVDVGDILGQALDLVRATVPTTIELRRSVEPGSEVEADITQLTQVILNLCTNAAQSMPDGGVLDVSLAAVEIDETLVAAHPELTVGRMLRLTVSDTGPGIAPEIMERVFEPFFTTKEVGQGTGLGLSQVHGIVASHGGGVLLFSELARGTTVQVYLPLVVGEAVTSGEVAGEDSVIPGTERVLLVDDEPAVAALASRVLESLGYSVHVEWDPVAAVAHYRRSPHSFHAVVTDLTMPGMTGLELIDALREQNPDMPALLMSGHAEIASPELEERGIRFLMKPFTRSQLSHSLREALGGMMEVGG